MDKIVNKLQDYYDGFLVVLPRLALAIVILVAGIFIVRWLSSVFGKKIRNKSHDPLMSGFIVKTVKLALFVCIFLLALNVAGLSGIAGALLATAGASAIIIGFAFKDIAENFIAGILLAFNRPFHIDDTVKIEDVFGKVKTMEFRYTKITTFDGRNVYIPNSDVLKKPVFNYTEDGFFRSDFVIGIAYENDIEKGKQIIQGCFTDDAAVVNDEQHVNFVVVDEMAASTVNLKVYFWVRTEDFRRSVLETRGRLFQNVKLKLEAAGFNLPADIRELKFYDASTPIQVLVTNGSTSNDNAASQSASR